MASDLDSFVKRNQKFLKLADGETVTVVYMGYVVGSDPRDPSKEKVTYKFKPEGFDRPLYLGSASVKFALKMKQVSEGETIQLTRHGMEKATDYEVVPV